MQRLEPIQLLVVDDEHSIRRLLEKELSPTRHHVITAGTARDALALVRRKPFDVIILDIQLPDGNGLELLERFRKVSMGAEIILVTGFGDIDSAVEAMKRSAYDYITKPFNLDRLELVVEKAYQRACLTRENRLLRHKQGESPPHTLIGNSPTLDHVRFLVQKVAPTQVPVLITGESGTGKNVVSRNIHHLSRRSGYPLITKNCGTLQKELILSELFGHRKGAFTGAAESRDGLLALAHKGTLFLDEIGELPMDVQASLLRVLESQTFRRVGGQNERRVDIRFIFATNRNLTDEVEAGRFSQALYHRINVFNIELAPLRERKEDIPLLVEHFRRKLSVATPPCQVSKKAMQCLMVYDWPGNIRELQNVIERGIILAEEGWITERGLPRELVEAIRDTPSKDTPFFSLADMEKNHIQRVMRFVGGNRAKASEILGIGRKTLYRKLKSYETENENAPSFN
ncbi:MULTISPECIES: sigma-54-dependent transcriptional regulator [Desulfococcus]|uniref:Two component, sigma54 specific, transcriptional regulator, Fis family n=1 Tax=Desulfococcus multivorans DSM 2059 TaxID=1121405 RepID=S7TMC7_DESML|nr:sigma-54 dependent transcriptional regulator [Desulfococcus multivorans]AOY59647.1 two component system response regulator, sigma54-specific [Desulfococcus multivorans]AQV01834.1 sigma-54-dependent Fis family transcriptional regulator [Desulfococcus multivorans]EPR37865.1 two component, sigma54 specific, transcriptional regulator, Fis family [Desulfococcus multivorans DSM 2059]SKA16425.1 two-component system, NtrC family, response regulator [Desulfococcus multivorans DSM 2059]